MKQEQGFTLVEMLITMAVLGTIIVIVLPIYPTTTTKSEIEFAMKQFEEDYLYMQQKAIAESKRIRIMINPAHSYYYMQELAPNSSGGQQAKHLLTRHLPSGLTFAKETGGGNDIVVNDNGHIISKGSLTFTYHLQGKTYRRKYIFQIHTGRFRIEEHVY